MGIDMQNNLLLFVVFSIFAAILLNLIRTPKIKTVFLFGITVFFYLLCDYKYFIILAAAVVWSFFAGQMTSRAKEQGQNQELWLAIGIVPVALTLFFFKWSRFFPLSGIGITSLIMPLGLSYYAFKIISYLVDVYTGKTQAETSFINYSNYVAFFPQIICGPISRINELGVQLKDLKRPDRQKIENGVYLIITGVFKKIVIADRVSFYVRRVFDSPDSFPALALWIAAFFYTIEIYCDFAGYSEIVIGICNLMGIECGPNFKNPYFSYSITDFWDRWHISLSGWLRDYIYIPLGGNRRGNLRKKLNILITFLVSGIWHGAGLTFTLWGIWHGILSCIPIKKSKNVIIRAGQILITFVLVMFGWIMFNSYTAAGGIQYIMGMFKELSFGMDSIIASVMPMTNDYSCLSFLLITIAVIFAEFLMELREISSAELSSGTKCTRSVILIIMIVMLGTWGQNSFIYAGF